MAIFAFLGLAWENVVVGLIGGFTVSFIFAAIQFIKNKGLEHKYPISGEYITKFEDIVDGVTVASSAIATLKQKGKRVYGTTTSSGDGRTWIISGEIDGLGNFHGVYYAEDPHDKGMGNFFLRISHNKTMIGLWSGYDSVNDIVNSGKYTFRPVQRNTKIITAEKKSVSRISQICDNELGHNYFKYNEIQSAVEDVNGYICKAALVNNRVEGFAICKLLPGSQIDVYLGVDSAAVPPYVLHSETVAVIKTVAVDKKYQGLGIGQRLVADCVKEFLARKVNVVASTAWKQNGSELINIDGILKQNGLRAHKIIDGFWTIDSVEKNYTCPSCGNPPCRCSVVLYFGTLVYS